MFRLTPALFYAFLYFFIVKPFYFEINYFKSKSNAGLDKDRACCCIYKTRAWDIFFLYFELCFPFNDQ